MGTRFTGPIDELRKYAGYLSERVMARRRIPTAEIQGYADRYGRAIDRTDYGQRRSATEMLIDERGRKGVAPLFGAGSTFTGANDPYTAGALYQILGGGSLGGAMGARGGYDAPQFRIPDRYLGRDSASQVGVHRRDEIIYRCIKLIADASLTPKLRVERKTVRQIEPPRKLTVLEGRSFPAATQTAWDSDLTHPVARLLVRPNPTMTGKKLIEIWLTNRNVFGCFFAEKIRNDITDKVVELWPIDPRLMRPKSWIGNTITVWEFTVLDAQGSEVATREIPARNVLWDPLYDPANPYFGELSPVSVCLGTAVADIGHTDFVRNFFDNKGVPGGILTVKNKTLSQPEADQLKRNWWSRFTRRSGGTHDIAILDQNAEYQDIGSRLDQLDTRYGGSMIECKLCTVFGVPPVLIFTFAGISRATYNNAEQAERHFWSSTLMTTFESIADKLTWDLLADFEGDDPIVREDIRLKWDYSEVKALQEDTDKVHARARDNVTAGIWLVSEGREATGAEVDPYSGYYTRQTKSVPSYPDIAAADAALLGPVPSVQVISTGPGQDVTGVVNSAAQTGGKIAADAQANLQTDNPQADAVGNAEVSSKPSN